MHSHVMKAIDLPDAAHVVHARARTHQRSLHRRTLQDTVSRGVLARIATVRHARTILGHRTPKSLTARRDVAAVHAAGIARPI